MLMQPGQNEERSFLWAGGGWWPLRGHICPLPWDKPQLVQWVYSDLCKLNPSLDLYLLDRCWQMGLGKGGRIPCMGLPLNLYLLGLIHPPNIDSHCHPLTPPCPSPAIVPFHLCTAQLGFYLLWHMPLLLLQLLGFTAFLRWLALVLHMMFWCMRCRRWCLK